MISLTSLTGPEDLPRQVLFMPPHSKFIQDSPELAVQWISLMCVSTIRSCTAFKKTWRC